MLTRDYFNACVVPASQRHVSVPLRFRHVSPSSCSCAVSLGLVMMEELARECGRAWVRKLTHGVGM